MNDLTNSFFKFNNSFKFDEFNQDEKQNDKNENSESDSEEEKKASDINEPAPKIDLTKGHKMLSDWLDAEYNSNFHYRKVTVPIKKAYNTNIISEELDINDPITIYDSIKKYANFLYDCNCPKETEKIIIECLEREFKEYYNKKHSTEGLDKHLNTIFIKLKNKYLLNANNITSPIVPQNKITYETTELINKLENQ